MEQRAMKRLSPRERAKEITCKTVNYFFLVLVSLFFLFPFFFMLFKAMMGDAESIGKLVGGQTVTKTGEDGDWIKIEFEGQTGYVRGDMFQ